MSNTFGRALGVCVLHAGAHFTSFVYKKKSPVLSLSLSIYIYIYIFIYLFIIQQQQLQLSAISQYGGSHDQRFSDSACCRLIGLHCNLQIAAFNLLKPSGHYM